MLQSPHGLSTRWLCLSLGLLLWSSWSNGDKEPVEFTVEVFPQTEQGPATPPTHSSAEPEHTQPEVARVTGRTTLPTIPPTTTEPPPPSTTTLSTLATTTTTSLPTTTTPRATTTTTAIGTTQSSTTEATTTTATTSTTIETTTLPETTTIPTTTTTERPRHCRPNRYCKGRRFPEEFRVSGHKFRCDQVPLIRQHCCLPHGHHLVCYNITVDGEHLNFHPDKPILATDYMDLCDIMLHSQNLTAGAYSTISTDINGGRLAYRYKSWVRVPPGHLRIKDIACMTRNQARWMLISRQKGLKKDKQRVNTKENVPEIINK